MKESDTKLLSEVESELVPVFAKLHELRDRCEAGKEARIAWEIAQGIRCLNECVVLIQLYRSGVELPTLQDIQRIYKESTL